MRFIFTLLTSLYSLAVLGQQEHPVVTEITDVTVFLKSAQIERSGNLTLTDGEHILKFSDLSPFIDKNSIQINANKSISILSVNYQLDYLTEDELSNSYRHYNSSIDSLERLKRIENAMIEVLDEDMDLLIDNRQVTNESQAVTPSQVDAMAKYHSKRMKELKLERIDRVALLGEINDQIKLYYNQIELSKNDSEAMGEILVKVDVKSPATIPLILNYVTENASWYPSYDITVDQLDQPMFISYKANVIQQTKEDWEDVSLTFSSNNPTISSVAPEIKPYYLDYHLLPPSYDDITRGISGIVRDRTGEPLIGANILIKGTTIGTITDIDGTFELPRPDFGSQITVSYIGYISQDLYIQNRPMSIILEEKEELLDEVVVTGYSGNSRKSSHYEKESKGEEELVSILLGKVSGMSTQPIPVTLKENTTSVSFEIDRPYTIKSDHQAYAVEMVGITVPTRYEYLTIPKINNHAYLIAHLEDWEQYNFLAGQANIILENTFIGSSLLDLSGAKEILKISLGIDKSVYVNREQKQDYKAKKFLGKNKTEIIEWVTLLKNNKEQPINIKVLDQIPVSNNDEIEVSVEESNNAEISKEIGLCTWQLTLNPNQQQELRLIYEVKYPKNRQLVIE